MSLQFCDDRFDTRLSIAQSDLATQAACAQHRYGAPVVERNGVLLMPRCLAAQRPLQPDLVEAPGPRI